MCFEEIIKKIVNGKISNSRQLDEVKKAYAIEHGIGRFIRNSEILNAANKDDKKYLINLLQKKPTRTISGVAVVAAMTMPHECPHGRCKYCPGGPDLNVPQSYTGKEPAARRAIQYGFHPFLQVTFRLHQLKSIGHPIDKVELIVMGGTLTSQCLDYQEWFVKQALSAMNGFEANYLLIKELGEEGFIKKFNESVKVFKYMEDIQSENEVSKIKCIGITFEPRPDYARREQIDFMLDFGVTRVEVGVQNPDDKVYELIDRGHTVEDVVKATQELKDSAIKVGYHIMPGLQGYDPDGDLKVFERIFSDSNFMPDMIKIYPCLVMEGTDYSKMMAEGKFTPISTKEAVEIISKAKAGLPKWVRTMRIMRDIPSNIVEAGIKHSNLGQLVYNYMDEHNLKCSCIRCREAGRQIAKGVEPHMDDIKLLRTEYDASGGKEIFLSFEDVKKDMLIGFARLRIPFNPHRAEITEDTALIRELHVYGPMVEVGEKPSYEWQHRGYGTELLREAELIAHDEYQKTKMCVISGVGARGYYKNLGYRRDGPYMSRILY